MIEASNIEYGNIWPFLWLNTVDVTVFDVKFVFDVNIFDVPVFDVPVDDVSYFPQTYYL